MNPLQLASIQFVQKWLSDDLLSAQQLTQRSGIHFTEGHCAVAAEAVYYLLGGKAAGYVPVVLPRKILGNNTHWWVRHKNTNIIVDPTAEQFGDEPIPYHHGVPCGFMCHPSKRTKTLIKRVFNDVNFRQNFSWRPNEGLRKRG